MAIFARRGVVLILPGIVALAAAPDTSIVLREVSREGASTRVLMALKAEGTFIPGSPPGAAKPKAAKPLALRVETRLDFGERVIKIADDRARRTARRVVQAASAINGEIRPAAAVLRSQVALLVAERQPDGVFVFSPAGPLTRAELELVQSPGDPLSLAALLPAKPVSIGARWRVDDEAARDLTAYDTLNSNGLEAILESADERTARVRLTGKVRGAVLGGEGTMICEGTLTFDRREALVSELTLRRTETRKAGPVEAGLDMKSTVTVTRRAIPVPAELSDSVVAGLPAEPASGSGELLLTAQSGAYTLRHGRDWHLYWDDTRLTVLKRLDHGTPVAQCNLTIGPNAGKGRHQDLQQFRDDVRRALGKRFGSILGSGEVDGDPAGGFRYKIGVRGHEGDLGVIWYYFLVAGPEGDQVLATFTLTEDQAKTFGDQDLHMIGSLRWKTRADSPKKTDH
jgi:hypothetical protein